MIRLAVGLVSVFVLLHVTRGFSQEESAPAMDPGQAFVAGLTGFDKSLCGETKLRARYMGVLLGEGVLVVERAPEAAEGMYRLTLRFATDFGENAARVQSEEIVSEKLGLLSASHRTEQKSAGESSTTTATVRRAMGHSIWLQTLDDFEPRRFWVECGEPDFGGDLATMVIARKLGKAGPGKYTLRGIRWPDDDLSEGAKAELMKVVFAVRDAKAISVDGREVKTREVYRMWWGEKADYKMVVTTDGRLVSAQAAGVPYLFVAEEFAGKPPDLPSGLTGASSPRGAVTLYLEVAAGAKPVDELDRIVDWEAARGAFKIAMPEVAALDAAAFATLMKGAIKQQVSAFSAEDVVTVATRLDVKMDGDRALVTIPGKNDQPFELERIETGWVITRLSGS